jgi:diguanylate cyclase (GGDEF)-like protein
VSDRPHPVDGDHGRARARREAQLLMVRVQTDLAGSTAAARQLVATCDDHGWADAALLAEYVSLIASATGGDASAVAPGVAAVYRRAEQSDDPAALSLALAIRARMARQTDSVAASASVETDLARAVVLLERGDGRAVERVSAHVECGLCFDQRHFWEMEVEQYEAALAIDVIAEEPVMADLGQGIAGDRWAINNNLAELQSRWMCDRYLVADHTSLADSASEALQVIDEARTSGLPPEWLPELDAVRVLVGGLAGHDVRRAADDAAERLESGTPFHGAAVLGAALAWRSIDGDAAAVAVEVAVAELSASDLSVEHEVALLLAVELEADRQGGPTAGLRLARHEHRRRRGQRSGGMRSMQALLAAERFGAERASLERDARIDELTRLANRRGYHRFLEQLERSHDRPVAMLVIDVDRFKAINDRFGHEAGDRALRRVAGVISGQARPDDLAARMGGDEFVLILDGARADTATRRAEQIVGSLARAGRGSPAAEYPGAIAVSIGIAHGPADQVEVLNRRADAALYEAKSAGGGRVILSTIPVATAVANATTVANATGSGAPAPAPARSASSPGC